MFYLALLGQLREYWAHIRALVRNECYDVGSRAGHVYRRARRGRAWIRPSVESTEHPAGYTSDWNELSTWCTAHRVTPLPANPGQLARYFSKLARDGGKVGTISRRRFSIKFVHEAANVASPLDDAMLNAVWEGIGRTHGASPDQATPLMPPLLWECLEATPTRQRRRPLADLRDHAVILIGFAGACRASELVGIDVEHLEEHDNGIVLHVPRSKNSQRGETDQLEILPRSKTPGRCPVAAIHAWRRAARFDTGPLLRGLERTGQPRSGRISHTTIVNILNDAITRTGTDPHGFSPHSLRAGFVT